jgi:hypothetical protein
MVAMVVQRPNDQMMLLLPNRNSDGSARSQVARVRAVKDSNF